MAGVSIRIDDKAAQAAFARLDAAGADLSPLMANLGAALLASTQQRFETETAPSGSPWPQSLRAALDGGKTLRDSGRLYQSLTYQAGPRQVEIGSNVVYAAIHQLGGKVSAKSAKALRFKVGGQFVTKKSVTIPARPFLGVDDGDRREIQDQVSAWLARAAA